MPVTTNKLLSVQAATSNAGTWGAGASYALNEGVITPLDLMLGGVLTKTLSNVNITLSATEIQYAMLRLTGTLTGNVQITSSNIGFYMVENVTSGAFAVTLTNTVNTITINQSQRYLLFGDATNGVRFISAVDLTGQATQFATGTTLIFIQASAPTGWTASTTYDNYALRVNSTAPTSGGTVNFSTLFARTATDNFTLTAAEIPTHNHDMNSHTHAVSGTTGIQNANHVHTAGAHTHTYSIPNASVVLNNGTGAASAVFLNTLGSTTTGSGGNVDTAIQNADHAHSFSATSGGPSIATTSNVGSGGAHAHNIDMRVKYVDGLLAVKA